ncbi:Dabb family protein [Rhodococcus erythropolis]|uniref:Dabb family protein n=1 Tax=Rhodococcus erythropolis TaxID=1833 RepID=UPI0008780A64|nr:Dabb family protein [Rhodococcus erythropolis]OFV73832.1 stress responsive A/B barrel domain protein [Rhodococcus erythropolis]
MIKHVVAFKFRSEISDLDQQYIFAALNSFPDDYPTMRNWTLAPNSSNRDDTMSHAFIVEFDTRADLDAYLTGAAHEKFVQEVWRPAVKTQIIVTLESVGSIADSE